MVRLKEDGQAVHTLLQLGFNSNMVRLKAFEARELGYVISCFNSNMVRLKDGVEVGFFNLNDTFQFQYGSIKR